MGCFTELETTHLKLILFLNGHSGDFLYSVLSAVMRRIHIYTLYTSDDQLALQVLVNTSIPMHDCRHSTLWNCCTQEWKTID